MCVSGGGGGGGRWWWWWWRKKRKRGGGIRTSSLPESDAVRAATMAVLIWRTYNTSALIER